QMLDLTVRSPGHVRIPETGAVQSKEILISSHVRDNVLFCLARRLQQSSPQQPEREMRRTGENPPSQRPISAAPFRVIEDQLRRRRPPMNRADNRRYSPPVGE